MHEMGIGYNKNKDTGRVRTASQYQKYIQKKERGERNGIFKRTQNK